MARKTALDVVRADPKAFVRTLVTARRERAQRFGRIGRIQDPDLKESLGGLRDLQIVGWLGAALGIDVPSDRRATLDAGLDLILAARAALHRVGDVRDDRLADAQQEAVAGELGFAAESHWESRDVLMRTLARTGRRVAAIVDDLLVETREEPDEVAGSTHGVAGFVDLVAGGGWDPASVEAFVGLLADGLADPAIAALDEHGLLDALLPGWADVAGRPQHDPYHRYPVDVHLSEAASGVARLLTSAPSDDPVAAAAAASTADPGAVLLGALLHDAGKVGLGSHVSIGLDVAGRVLDRMGVGGQRRDQVLFLVREHLLLSDTATRRNLDDEDLILHVAARVRDRERMGMLYLLTMADAHATGPSASSPWRIGLIRELVGKVDRAFDRGLMDADRASEVERAESAIRSALAAEGIDPEAIERFLDVTPPAYALWVEPDHAPAHLAMALPPPGDAEVRVHVAPGRSPGTWVVTVGAHDRLGLLATIAGAFAVSGISILTARAFTTSDGVALDAFDLSGSFPEDIGDERWARFEALLAATLEGTVDMPARVKEWRSHYRAPAVDIPVKVSVTEDVSDYFTLFEVQAADRLGLLFDLAGAFAEAGVDVHVAQAATYGPRIVDVFYVTEQAGGKLEDPERIDGLRVALAAAAAVPIRADDASDDPGA
jgi:[protein-PII] uridylyltransferase